MSSGWKTKHLAAWAAALLSSLVACGPTETGTTPAKCDAAKQGITDCSSVKCQAGQYCDDPRFAMCLSGCLSDVNCACNQVCVKTAGDAAGTCQNSAPPPPPPPPPDAGQPPVTSMDLTRCLAACEKAQQCNYYSVGDVVQCKAGCDSVGDVVRKALADCVQNAACGSTLPSCFDPNCSVGAYTCCGIGAPFTCAGGMNCVGHVCL